ncbi:MAG: DUF4428 domain-containing protein [Oscillospiraceae bacterium]
MGLFDKKYCDVCGEKIGLLGNRKLEDGNLCKQCAAKLSPWFSDRRRSTVAEIKEQLDYREENKAAVEAFNTTRTLGVGTKVLLDEDAQKFMVTSARNLRDANPDVMSFSQVTGCRVDVEEDKTELKREDKDGKQVSYNPPRYTYEYDFYVIINVNTPYFDEIRFKLNNSSIESPVPISKGGSAGAPMGMPRAGIGMQRPGMQRPGMGMQHPGMGGGIPVEYEECEKLGEEIKAALTQVRAEVRQAVAEANAPKTAVTCPWCGATTTPDASGTCEYCGGALNG